MARYRPQRIRDLTDVDPGVLNEIESDFAAQKEQFGKEDLEMLVKNPPETPNFPEIMFAAALAKDILDSLDISGIGALLTTLTSFALAIVLFLWTIGKTNGGWWKQRMIKQLWIRYVGVIVIESIPLLKLVPSATIFILLTHYRETKIAELLNGALEKIKKAGM